MSIAKPLFPKLVIAKYGGMEAIDIKKIKDLEHENQMFADLSLECRALKDVIEKKSFKNSDKACARQLSDDTVYDEHTRGMLDVIAEQMRRDEPVIQRLTEAAECYPSYGFKKLFQVLAGRGTTGTTDLYTGFTVC